MGGAAFKAEAVTDSGRYQIAISEAIHDLIGILDDPRLTKVDGTKVLEHAAKLSFDNNFAEMARTIGMPKNTLSEQLTRGTKPKIETLAALSVTTGVPLKHMILCSATGRRVRSNLIKEPLEKPTECAKTPKREMLNLAVARAELTRALQGARAPSLADVAKKLGSSARSLRKHFPELSHAISDRHLSHRHAKSNARTERICKRIFNAVMTLVLAEEFPTNRRLAEILGPAICLEYRAFYVAVLQRYDLLGKGRAPAPVQRKALLAARQKFIEQNLQKQ
ncbi:helix-turn-helix domain-containing protein [Paraburkholderia caribensis]|uniref:helix-turn-helix domain-containing protein n=1 Tax=Paraburkholderia caribensis TaxID=75105 RepID=UPI001CC4707E|nr:helix-turn-helix domain-containing protein [Paraburkholderia caribensis]